MGFPVLPAATVGSTVVKVETTPIDVRFGTRGCPRGPSYRGGCGTIHLILHFLKLQIGSDRDHRIFKKRTSEHPSTVPIFEIEFFVLFGNTVTRGLERLPGSSYRPHSTFPPLGNMAPPMFAFQPTEALRDACVPLAQRSDPFIFITSKSSFYNESLELHHMNLLSHSATGTCSLPTHSARQSDGNPISRSTR